MLEQLTPAVCDLGIRHVKQYAYRYGPQMWHIAHQAGVLAKAPRPAEHIVGDIAVSGTANQGGRHHLSQEPKLGDRFRNHEGPKRKAKPERQHVMNKEGALTKNRAGRDLCEAYQPGRCQDTGRDGRCGMTKQSTPLREVPAAGARRVLQHQGSIHATGQSKKGKGKGAGKGARLQY